MSDDIPLPLSRRGFMKSMAAGAATTALGQTASALAAPGGERPDVLFIAIEDVSPHRFGCYGNTVCKTPHLDKFATTALQFNNAYTNPPCCPSRTALLLGRRPETTRVFGNNDDWHKTFPNALTLPRHFRNNGYETIRCGKMYHGKFEDPESWDRDIKPHEGMPQRKHKRKRPEGPGIMYREKLKEARKKGKGGSAFTYGPSGLEDWEEKDGMVAAQGIKLLSEKSDKPRLICLGMHAPHLPFIAPDKYFEPYPWQDMKIPMNPGADETGMPKNKKIFKWYNPSTIEQWKKAIAAHYACTSFVDAQIGRILDALDKSGRADKTIVVIWSDHGFMLGEHFLWRKGPMYDESTQVALWWRAPGVTKPGTTCARPVETIDIFPTIMDLCGIPQPPGLEAMSMKPLLADPERPWKKGALMWGGKRRRSIVTEKWRYSQVVSRPNAAQLFDRQADPKEFKNLAGDPQHAETAKRLKALLEGGWKACLPEKVDDQ